MFVCTLSVFNSMAWHLSLQMAATHRYYVKMYVFAAQRYITYTSIYSVQLYMVRCVQYTEKIHRKNNKIDLVSLTNSIKRTYII